MIARFNTRQSLTVDLMSSREGVGVAVATVAAAVALEDEVEDDRYEDEDEDLGTAMPSNLGFFVENLGMMSTSEELEKLVHGLQSTGRRAYTVSSRTIDIR